MQTNTLSSTAGGNITVRAVTPVDRDMAHGASGVTYGAALAGYRQSIPDRGISLQVIID